MACDSKTEQRPPSFESFYAFLKANYRHSRFEGRNGKEWGDDYSHRLAKRDYEALVSNGFGFISRHESQGNQIVKYDYRLLNINADLNPADYPAVKGNLTHLF